MSFVLALLTLCGPALQSAPTMSPQDSFLPHEKHVLANGLQVILHEDHSSPVVAVYVYYHVGSSREVPGRSGFAHLFEHMLFQGSQHVGDNDHFRLIQEAGGTLNGSTTQDRTNYFEILPANQLELALWLESDRMGFLLPAMTQEKLDNQRDVVRNERRQSYENRPYGLVREVLLKNLFPADHPYSWPTIGSMEDLAQASLEDVSGFFHRWYGPNNATIAIGGDFDPDEALAMVERYFGPIPRGPEVEKPPVRDAHLDADRRVVMEDRVQLPQVTMVWPTVAMGNEQEATVNLLSDVLSANRSSILDHVLMEQEEIASSVTISNQASERAGYLTINVRPRPGVTLDRLEERVGELIDALAERGIDPARVERLKTRRIGDIVRGLETVGARTNRLARDNCFFGDPDRVGEEIAAIEAVSADAIQEAARRYLSGRPHLVISVVPVGHPELAAGATAGVAADEDGLDRSVQPAPGPQRPFHSPEVWRATLANGLPVYGTAFDSIPLTWISLAVPAGRLFETPANLGLAELTARMLNEGTEKLSGLQWTDTLDGMGATFSVGSTDDEIVLGMSVLNEHREEAMELLSDLVTSPRFAEEDFERIRRQQLLDIETQVDRPRAIASEVFARLLFGSGVAGAPRLGTPETLEALTVDDVRAFWNEALVPARSHLSIVGDLDAAAASALCASLGEAWLESPSSTERSPATLRAIEREGPLTICLVDKPGAEQSELRIGHGGISRRDDDWFGAYAMNYVLGGSFTSRINLNLREDKGYTYGARSAFVGSRTGGYFVVSTAVQTAVTAPALVEALREVRGILDGIQPEEADFARQAISLSLQRAYESGSARLAFLGAIGGLGLPEDYPERRLAWLESMDAATLDALAHRLIHPDRLVVLVVGDRAEIENDLRGLDIGEVVLLGPHGERLPRD
ncbi:MAG TPA: insulinase family protein [Planctomycetes bacterium]|nr:insulinase family protein [Planctomycetota bacterium]